jgi:DNA-binding MarR family transcriptional regulator
MPTSSEACARAVLETLPMVMRAIRAGLREQATPGLSEAQFRTMLYLYYHRGASLSDLAEFHGLALSSMSRLVDGLVAKGVVTRAPHAVDRRRIALGLTPRGRAVLRVKMAATRARLASLLTPMAPQRRAAVVVAMRSLRGALGAHRVPRRPRGKPMEAEA